MKKVIIRREKAHESLGVHLWFEDRKFDFVASLVGDPGDIRLRMSTPKKRGSEWGAPFAAPTKGDIPLLKNENNVKSVRSSIVRHLKEQGYKASAVKNHIVIMIPEKRKRKR